MSKLSRKPAIITKRDLIKKTSTKIFIAVAVAAVVVSFSLVALNFLWSLSGHYQRVVSQKDEASRVLSQNIENIELLQNSFIVLEAGEVDAGTVLDALPSRYDFPALATTIESLVARNDVVLESFSGDDIEVDAIQFETEPMPIEIPFSLSVKGSYSSIREFISEIHLTIRPIRIINIELEGYYDAMEATMRAITYYQPRTSLEVETRTIE